MADVRQWTPEEMRAQLHLKGARETITGSLASLASEVRQLGDVRAWVQKEPLLFAGLAAFAGFLLAHKPRAAGTLVAKFLPGAALTAAKPMLEQLGAELGTALNQKMRGYVG